MALTSFFVNLSKLTLFFSSQETLPTATCEMLESDDIMSQSM